MSLKKKWLFLLFSPDFDIIMLQCMQFRISLYYALLPFMTIIYKSDAIFLYIACSRLDSIYQFYTNSLSGVVVPALGVRSTRWKFETIMTLESVDSIRSKILLKRSFADFDAFRLINREMHQLPISQVQQRRKITKSHLWFNLYFKIRQQNWKLRLD